MRPLNVTRFKQDPAHCTVAASASVANYFNPGVDYQLARHVLSNEVVKSASDGLYSGETGLLLNQLGFRSVTLITCDLDMVDHSWSHYSTAKQVEAIDEMLRSRSIDSTYRLNLKALRKFLVFPNRHNRLIIDFKFADYIRESLDLNKPLVLSFNWNMLLRYPKQLTDGTTDYVKGSISYHAVCARGYNKKGVYIVDSHHEFYKRQWKKYKNGFYFIPWEDLLPAMGNGDLLIVDDYDPELLQYELVQEIAE
jgi:hypothetical protein